jgi:hypothetical protein
MKSSLILISFAYTALSTPLFVAEGEQGPFNAGLMTSYPGFTLDLNAQRLVQTEDGEPVWMTEMNKVCHPQLRVSLTRPYFILLHRSEPKRKASNFSTCDITLSCHHSVFPYAQLLCSVQIHETWGHLHT